MINHDIFQVQVTTFKTFSNPEIFMKFKSKTHQFYPTVEKCSWYHCVYDDVPCPHGLDVDGDDGEEAVLHCQGEEGEDEGEGGRD